MMTVNVMMMTKTTEKMNNSSAEWYIMINEVQALLIRKSWSGSGDWAEWWDPTLGLWPPICPGNICFWLPNISCKGPRLAKGDPSYTTLTILRRVYRKATLYEHWLWIFHLSGDHLLGQLCPLWVSKASDNARLGVKLHTLKDVSSDFLTQRLLCSKCPSILISLKGK